MRRLRTPACAAVFALWASAASAGPPFLTDDPEPTEPGHWEIYGPYATTDGRGPERSGEVGVELNYGLAPDVQFTLGLPAAYDRDAAGTRWGAGDLEASLKVRVYENKAAGVQVAVFPAVTLPTARPGLGAGRVTASLPVWVQKDAGPWSLFGGGGLAINPGPGNRNYWSGGIALARQFGSGVQIGVEADRQGADTAGGSGTTMLGLGAIVHVAGPLRLLASGGPTFSDAGGPAGYHGYAALGWDF